MENIRALVSGQPPGGKPKVEGNLRLFSWLPCGFVKLRESGMVAKECLRRPLPSENLLLKRNESDLGCTAQDKGR